VIDFGNLLTAGILATAIPTLLGILIGYSIIAINLGIFLWTAKSVPDDVGIALFFSGLSIGALMVIGIIFIRLSFS
jgi:hypothetical protein